MLLELAAANAAFEVIKQALANGKEFSDMGSRVFDYFDNKAKLQQKASKKGGGSELQEFMALEKLKLQEEQLRERMIYAGRPGMWDDWLRFQAAAARKRREDKEANSRAVLRRKIKVERFIEYVVITAASVILAGLLIYGLVLYMMYGR
tara:strand:+ start:236 stop:682 length:447 start_codon:yes stop_codon:yes gene_type:complete